MAVQIFNILIGQKYRSDCPIEGNIPSWLIVHSIGALIVIVNCLMIMKWKLRRNFFIAIMLTILVLVWLVKGSAWVYPIYKQVDFKPVLHKENYCNVYCYFTVFGNITAIWSILVLSGLYYIFKRNFSCRPNSINSDVSAGLSNAEA